ncbi:MAG: transcription antitermination factor NusB [bacterium]|nr:transcription antitermination factor NusB [bacterium]
MFRIKHCREVAFKLLYQIDSVGYTEPNQPEDEPFNAEKILQNHTGLFKGLNDIERKFVTDILEKVHREKDSIDQLIAQNLIGWKLERLMKVDRNLLRLGIAESYSNDQKAVIIDDVIRMAKKYAGEESYKIINAILDKVIR